MKALRFYHVSLAVAALIAYFTAEELGLVHAWVGYGVAALLTVRLLLGLLGKHGFEFKRWFPSFAPPPRGQTGIRHPAVSRALVLGILICTIGAAGTGIAMDRGGTLVGQSIRLDDEKGEHREKHDDDDDGERMRESGQVIASEQRNESTGGESEDEEEGLLGELHETFGNLMLPLVALHVLYLLVFRFELARFMLFLQPRRA